MIDRQVVVIGAGPTGMMLAAELALASIDAVAIERLLKLTPDCSSALRPQ